MRKRYSTKELLTSPLLPWRILFADIELIKALTIRLWQMRFKGSFLSFLWAFITPVFLLAVYYIAFGIILDLRSSPNNADLPYALTMFCGMAIYNIFAETISSASYCIISQSGYVKKASFDLEVIPFASFGSSVISGGAWITVAIFTAVFCGKFSYSYIHLPPLICIFLLWCCGGVFWVSAGSVFLRDLPLMLSLFIQGCFFLTPIIYPVSAVPDKLKIWININPMTHFVENIRGVILGNAVPDSAEYLIMLLSGIIVFYSGFIFFNKTSRGFADVM